MHWKLAIWKQFATHMQCCHRHICEEIERSSWNHISVILVLSWGEGMTVWHRVRGFLNKSTGEKLSFVSLWIVNPFRSEIYSKQTSVFGNHLGFARSMLLIRTFYLFLVRPSMRKADLPPEDLESEQDHGFCRALISWSLVQTLSPTLSVQDDFDDLPQDRNSQKKKRRSWS